VNDLTPETDIAEACRRILAGGLVAIPTETVYGLAADATNPDGVKQIFQLKGRPADHPLIVHIGQPAQLDGIGENIPPPLRRLADAFWPGPLTLVVTKTSSIPDCVTGGQPTVAVRMPDHPVALALLRACHRPLAAPSANRYQHISPTTAAHVRTEFAGSDLLVLDGGACRVGLESTIVAWDDQQRQVRILRPGGISQHQLEAVLGNPVVVEGHDQKISGNVDTHYAPVTPAYLAGNVPKRLSSKALFTIALDDSEQSAADDRHQIVMPMEAEAYAQQLYAVLRRADDCAKADGLAAIRIIPPPQTQAWAAVWDRLNRLVTD
jgi:L-threonylcarbamoyladenylate synthase